MPNRFKQLKTDDSEVTRFPSDEVRAASVVGYYQAIFSRRAVDVPGGRRIIGWIGHLLRDSSPNALAAIVHDFP